MGFPLYILASGFILYVLWTTARPRWTIKIVVTSGHVDFVKGVAENRRGKLEDFFLNDLKPIERLTIQARREKNGRLSISIKGPIDSGLKQRIRNYLLMEL